MIRDQTVSKLEFYDLSKFVKYKFLSIVDRYAGYKQLQNWFQNKCGGIWVRVPEWQDQVWPVVSHKGTLYW